MEYFKNLRDYCDVYYVTTSKEKEEATYNKVKKEIKLKKGWKI